MLGNNVHRGALNVRASGAAGVVVGGEWMSSVGEVGSGEDEWRGSEGE